MGGSPPECVFDGPDVGDVRLVGEHPFADAGVEVFELFDDQGAAQVFSLGCDLVEGDDERVAELGESSGQRDGCVEVHGGALDEFGSEGSDDGSV